MSKNIIDTMKKRTSIRTYENRELNNEVIDKLKSFSNNIKAPFEPKVRFGFINTKLDEGGTRLGTYGVIKGASEFIGVAVEKGSMDLENLGYAMEDLVLYATSLELGTCWMGGTFKKGAFAEVMKVKENEIFPIVSPIGYKAEPKFIDRFFKVGKGDRRKPWKELFFNKSFNNPIDEKGELGDFAVVLECVRLAPSAINKQPWRIVKDDDKFYFYMDGSTSENSFQRIDMGIAMCHFHSACKGLGLKGNFLIDKPKIEAPSGIHYIATYKVE